MTRGMSLTLFATAPRGLEELLAAELTALGASGVRLQPGGAEFAGSLALAYRVCLWSRVAGRVLLEVGRGPADDADALYATVRGIRWSEHLAREGTLAVDVTGTNEALVNTQFAAQKVKDAIVDQLRVGEARPSVERERPDLRVHVHLTASRRSAPEGSERNKRTGPEGHDRRDRPQGRDAAVVSIDLAGESLHRRGYREDGGAAPLKENLAAGILLRAGWPALAAEGGALLDPMCGSGTLLIEAAWIAGDRAPGLDRGYFGFLGWQGHSPGIWAELLADATRRAEAGRAKIPPIRGFDAAGPAIAAANANIDAAGVRGVVHVERRTLAEQLAHAEEVRPDEPVPKVRPRSLVVCNPPYGERLAEAEVRPIYAELGRLLKAVHMGDEAAILAPDREVGHAIGLRARRIHALYNGALQIHLLRFTVTSEAVMLPREARPRSPGATAFANRLAKNSKLLKGWAEREGTDCYRVYDADLPEYAAAIDVYGGHAHVQEYAPPREIDPTAAEVRLREVMRAVPEVLELPRERVHLKTRTRSKGGEQYGRQDRQGARIEVREGPARFLVNLTDYLDTGLFLDHRPTRALIGKLARGRRFLNLFAYTGTATVHAALGGAAQTTTVDMSTTYGEWTRDNLELNGIRGADHRVVTQECRSFMDREMRRYGLIFLDPPTFSNSKRMAGEFDVQRDHVGLIGAAVRLLERGGILIFSTNYRRFRLDTEALAELKIEDISRRTIPHDFERSPRIHQCWQIEKRER